MKKVLVIVAHPDDETIWMGGTLLKNKDKWNISIISLCRKNDRDRAPKFEKACKIYNAKNFISDLEDENLNPVDSKEIKKRILLFLRNPYDYVFTHGKNGEYGHIRHLEVHNTVKEMINKKILQTKKVFFFSYIKKNAKNTETGFDCYVNANANKFINLNTPELLEKKHVITDVYGFGKGGFEERNCRNKEGFEMINIPNLK